VRQLFDADYPQFKHDQTYAGTEKEEHCEDIFLTNTAYVALSRLFFVRICEDIGLTASMPNDLFTSRALAEKRRIPCRQFLKVDYFAVRRLVAAFESAD